MAFGGAVHTGTGAAVALSTLGVPAGFKQLDIYGNAGNASVSYVGGEDVTADGTVDAWIPVGVAKAWGTKVSGPGDQRDIDPSSTYVIAASDDLVHFVWIT